MEIPNTLCSNVYDFAFLPRALLRPPVDLADPEDWGPNNRILKNYLSFSFSRAVFLTERDVNVIRRRARRLHGWLLHEVKIPQLTTSDTVVTARPAWQYGMRHRRPLLRAALLQRNCSSSTTFQRRLPKRRSSVRLRAFMITHARYRQNFRKLRSIRRSV